MIKNYNKKGFTLAELLTTLTVIGVVAALSIPILFTSTSEAEFKAALKKDFADFSQVSDIIQNEHDGSLVNIFRNGSNTDAKGSETLKNYFRDKLKYVKECNGTSTYGGTGSGASVEGCWHSTDGWKFLSGSTMSSDFNPVYMPGLVLNNSSYVFFGVESTMCSSAVGDYSRCGYIYFDVNGTKNPNVLGKDIFVVSITDDGLIPAGIKGWNSTDTTCIPTGTGYGCTAKYLYDK